MSKNALVKVLDGIVEQTRYDNWFWVAEGKKGKKPTNINSTRQVMDKDVHVLHVHKGLFDDRALRNNIKGEAEIDSKDYGRLYTQYKLSVKEAIPRVGTIAEVNARIDQKKFTPVMFSNTKNMTKDFIIIAPSYSAMSAVLSVIHAQFSIRVKNMLTNFKGPEHAKVHFSRLAKASIEDVNSKSRAGLDQGHITAGSYAETNSPSARFANIAVTAISALESQGKTSPATLKATADVRKQLNKVKSAHDKVYTLKAEKSGSLEGVTGIFVLTMPQSVGVNRHSLGLEEKKLGQLVAKAIATVAGEIQSSPSIHDMLDVVIMGSLTGKSPKFKSKTSVTKTVKGSPGSKVKVKLFKRAGGAKKSPIRNARTGQFSSALQIKNLINARLHDQIKHNMGSPKLNYRTGRFARSAQVTEISMHRSNMISIYYTYMQNPYATFEPSGAQGSSARNPVTLITKSVRELAVELMKSKLRITRRFE
jgi:5-hydroxyisourate hydrolase-like protein (transthyretin family)